MNILPCLVTDTLKISVRVTLEWSNGWKTLFGLQQVFAATCFALVRRCEPAPVTYLASNVAPAWRTTVVVVAGTSQPFHGHLVFLALDQNKGVVDARVSYVSGLIRSHCVEPCRTHQPEVPRGTSCVRLSFRHLACLLGTLSFASFICYACCCKLTLQCVVIPCSYPHNKKCFLKLF